MSPKKRKELHELIERTDKATVIGAKIKNYWTRAKEKVKNLGYMIGNPATTLKFRRQIGPYYLRRAQLNDAKKQVRMLLRSNGIELVGSTSRVKTTRSMARNIEAETSMNRGIILPAKEIVDDPKSKVTGEVLREALGLRIFVKDEKTARKAFEILKKGEGVTAKDYVKAPRAGGYRAYHVINPAIEANLEIQIRTPVWERKISMFDKRLRAYHSVGGKLRRRRLKAEFNRVLGEFQAIPKQQLTRARVLNILNESILPPESQQGALEVLVKRKIIGSETENWVNSKLRKTRRKK
ncbi:MAG: hypothetical protein ABIH20_01080 [Candidatus Diapherotrites archaeon]